jgi:integrase
MTLLGLNCGFGPKDLQDLAWNDIDGERVTLPRSKTGVCQTFQLWPESRKALSELAEARIKCIERLAARGRPRTDGGRVFTTKYWRPWSKDAVAHQFRKLCKSVGVPCFGFYRLRHCASTAVSLVANPHVQRKFMRHSQLQQQVTYTHIPDAEVDVATSKARSRLLGEATEGSESGREQAGAA